MAVRAAEREPAVVPAQRQAKGSRLRGVQGGAVNESPEGPGTRQRVCKLAGRVARPGGTVRNGDGRVPWR